MLRYHSTSVIRRQNPGNSECLGCACRCNFFLSAGMLRRTKYSRLRNDSLASLEDRPQRTLTLKRDQCMDSDFALLEPGTPDHHAGSRLSSFIPRTGSAAPQSGLRGQTTRDQSGSGDHKEADWDWWSAHRLCNPPCSPEPLSGTKSPITLHRMTGLPAKLGCPCSPQRDGRCFLQTAAGERTAVEAASGSVHHNIKVPVATRLTCKVVKRACS